MTTRTMDTRKYWSGKCASWYPHHFRRPSRRTLTRSLRGRISWYVSPPFPFFTRFIDLLSSFSDFRFASADLFFLCFSHHLRPFCALYIPLVVFIVYLYCILLCNCTLSTRSTKNSTENPDYARYGEFPSAALIRPRNQLNSSSQSGRLHSNSLLDPHLGGLGFK